MKFHVIYDANEVFQKIQDLNLFDFCKSKEQEHVILEPNIKYINSIFPIANLLHDKMKENHFLVEELQDGNFALELWDKSFSLNSNPKQNKLKQQIYENCSFDSFSDNFSIVDFPIISCVVYFSKGDGIDSSNLLIRDGDHIRKIDVWSQKTIVLFDGDLQHCAEPSTVTDPFKDCHRQVLVLFVKKLNNKINNI